ncbi:MAG: hypothetical protein ACM3S4_10020 [Burkholderiales bacterium]
MKREDSVIEIRYTRPDDAKALGEIQSSSWRAAYKDIVPDDVPAAYAPEASCCRRPMAPSVSISGLLLKQSVKLRFCIKAFQV